MKRTLLLAALVGAIVTTRPALAAIDELFSPTDDLQVVWITHIEAAKKTVHIAAYGVSNGAIAAALEAAAKRGVEVCILEDRQKAQEKEDLHGALAAAGCRIIIKRSEDKLHDKMGDFDAGEATTAAIVGSYNLSENGEKIDNSIVVFDGEPGPVAKVEDAWRGMFRRETGRDYTAAAVAAPPSVTGPTTAPSSPAKPQAAPAPGDVWVDLTTGIYHRARSPYYGKTANGKYMNEQAALNAGYRPARGE